MGFENCVEMWSQDPNYKWNDCPCDGSIGKNAFICKAPATADGDISCPDCGDATEPPGVQVLCNLLTCLHPQWSETCRGRRKKHHKGQNSTYNLDQCLPEQTQKSSKHFQITNLQILNLGQPDNNNYKENCVEMWGTDPNFKWNDGPCDYKKAFVCKAPATADGDVNCPDCGDATDPPGDCK